jgi:hypothetical protein
MKKLYEYSIFIEINIVIAAETEEAVAKKAKSLTAGDILSIVEKSGDECSVVDDPQLFDLRDPLNMDEIEHEAHFVID